MKKEKTKHPKKKWEEIGLLQPVKEKDKAAITKLYNKALEICLSKPPDQDVFGYDFAYDAQTMIFPAIVRIYLKHNIKKLNVEHFYNELDEYFKKHHTELLEMNVIGVDGEAELLALFTDNYKEKEDANV